MLRLLKNILAYPVLIIPNQSAMRSLTIYLKYQTYKEDKKLVAIEGIFFALMELN